MEIIIPSKHIYSKSFDPVVDNNIDRIEVQAKEVVPDNHYDESVYNEETVLNTVTETLESHEYNTFTALNSGGTTIRYGVAVSGLYCVATYHNIPQLLIPKISNNHRIVKINTKENGNVDIKYSISFDVNYYLHSTSYKVNTGEIDYIGGSDSLITQKTNITGFSNNEIEYEQDASDISNNISSTTQDSLLSFSATNSIKLYKGPTAEDYSALQLKAYLYANSVNWVIPNTDYHRIENSVTKNIPFILMPNGKVASVTINNIEYYEITNIKILASINVYSLSDLRDFQSEVSEIEGYSLIRGLHTKTIPQGSIKITIYGDTIGIDLKNEIITVNSGNKVFSFDGNELIQTTNTPSAENKYQSIIDKWKSGKQTATIACPITDYYDKNGNKVIDISTSIKMIFQEGDIVIPYIYTNKGDKPLSYNKDFTPKRFKVIATKITKKQGGTQELTLQEI